MGLFDTQAEEKAQLLARRDEVRAAMKSSHVAKFREETKNRRAVGGISAAPHAWHACLSRWVAGSPSLFCNGQERFFSFREIYSCGVHLLQRRQSWEQLHLGSRRRSCSVVL